MGERETYVVMASMWSRSRSALARRFATILLGALCMYVYVSRSLFFFSLPRKRLLFAESCGSFRKNYREGASFELSPSSAPNVSHSLGENLYEKEMRRPITVL